MHQVISIRNEKNEVMEIGILAEVNGKFPYNAIPLFDGEKIVIEGIPTTFENAKKIFDKLDAIYFDGTGFSGPNTRNLGHFTVPIN